MHLKRLSLVVISIDEIKVKNRIREDLGNLDGLVESIRTNGLIEPIIVDENHTLIAGGRRLVAVKRLGWDKIEACVVQGKLSELKRLDLEMEENQYRLEFSNLELKKALKKRTSLIKKHTSSILGYYWFLFIEFLKKFFLRTRN